MQTTTQQTVTTYNAIQEQARDAATQAQADFLAKWNANTGGNEYGEPMYCGFAWVDVKVRSNSKLGKALKSVGFKPSWQSGYLQLWDPAENPGQSMDCKEIGAQAYADTFRNYGIEMYMGSRAD